MEKVCDSVLIVEDDYDIREGLEEWFRDEGYRVYSVRNGREAVSVLKLIPGNGTGSEQGRTLILLDMTMPVMDGWEFFEAQRQNALLSAMPVVVVSALGAETALVQPEKTLPAVGYIRKPISMSALMAIVQTHCRRIDVPRALARSA